MEHCELDDLALMALDEAAPSGAMESHVHTCLACQAELAQLSRVVTIGRSIRLEDQPVAPPPIVWDRIAAETGMVAPSDLSDARDLARVAPFPQTRQSRHRRWVTTTIAAAACLVVGAVVGSIVTRYADSEPVRGPAIVASTTLEPVPGGPNPGTVGQAKIEEVNGQYLLQVDATGLKSPSGFYEVWMMDPQNAGLVAVGTFNANQDRATFPIPDGLPMKSFNSVDISDEPFDGVPGHSAVSVLRGTFST